MSDPVVQALADAQAQCRRLVLELEGERFRRWHTEQLLDSAHRLICEQAALIDEWGVRPAREVTA